MDIKVKQQALSNLKVMNNAPFILPLIAANAISGTPDVSLNSLATLYRAKLSKSFKFETEIRELVRDSRNVQIGDVDLIIDKARQANNVMKDLKLGSINLPNYSLTVLSSGVKLDKVGAKTGFKVPLDKGVELKIWSSRFISEYISFEMFGMEQYNAVMNRIIVVKVDDAEVSEVVFSDFMLKLALVQDAGISLDTLLANPNMVLVLKFNGFTLKPIKHPLRSETLCKLIEQIYGVATYTAPSKANEGYIEFGVDLKGLVVEGSNGNLYSFLSAKKFAARQEKLNGDTAISRVTTDVFVITEMSESLNVLFNTGSFYASHKLLMSIGCCRLTSDINNLLIKGASHYAPWIIGEAGNTLSVVASSSSKGGVAGIAAALGQAFDFSKDIEVLPTFDVEELEVNGEIVKGVRAKVTLKITNAYTVENFMKANSDLANSSLDEAYAADVADKVECILGYDKAGAQALSASMFNEVATKRQSIIDVLCSNEEEGLIHLKPAVTTVTPGEFENIALSFGRDVARNYMDWLLANPFNRHVSDSVKAAAEFMTAQYGDVRTVSVYDMMEVVSEMAMYHNVAIDTKPTSMWNTQFLQQVVECLGLKTEELEWVFIKELKVHVPTGEALYKDLYKEANSNELKVTVATGLKYLLSSIMYLLTAQVSGAVNNVLLEITGQNLHFFIQDSLLNKKTAKLKAHGKYMTLLPGFWLKNKHDVCILSRDLYQPQFSHLKYTKVNIAKHPVLFLQAVAGFHCYNEIPNVEVTDELRAIFMNVVFVHPDYLLELQNDTDGDLARVTFDGYHLPLYTGEVMNSCAKAFHQNYIDGENELGINVNKAPKQVEFTHADLYKAIEEASQAKENVAFFTDNLHKLQAGIRTSPVTQVIMKSHPKAEAAAILKDVVIMTATLIQTDAMNAIKHGGGVTAGASLTSSALVDAEAVATAKDAVIEYLDEHKFVTCVDKELFANYVVDMFASIHMVFNANNRNKPFLTNQVERLVFKNQPSEVYIYMKDDKEVVGFRRLDFNGIFADSWNVTDSNNMYAELVAKFFGRAIKK